MANLIILTGYFDIWDRIKALELKEKRGDNRGNPCSRRNKKKPEAVEKDGPVGIPDIRHVQRGGTAGDNKLDLSRLGPSWGWLDLEKFDPMLQHVGISQYLSPIQPYAPRYNRI